MRLLIIIFLLPMVYDGNCQTSVPPLKDRLKEKPTTRVTKYLTEQKWNELFPNRPGKGENTSKGNDFYSFSSFITAASVFTDFLAEGDTNTQKKELAAFLANIAQETSGGWEEAPGGYFKWGLYYIQETDTGLWKNYCDASKVNYPGATGCYYYGRGPKQLSWNYNYGQFSEAWYGSKDTLLQHPEYLSTDPVLSFASAIWFWMTAQFPKPSCHDVMVGNWEPTPDDISKHRYSGFGATVNIINGGVECNGASLSKTKYRYQYYEYFCKYFNVQPGKNVECSNQKSFGQ